MADGERASYTLREIAQRFGGEVVGEKACRELGRMIMSIETQKSLSPLMRLMTRSASAPARSAGKPPRNGKARNAKRSTPKPSRVAARGAAKKSKRTARRR